MTDAKDKFPAMMIDSKLVDLNSMPLEELEELKVKLENKIAEIRNEIDKILEE